MTSRIKSVIIGKLDVLNHKASTSCSILLIKTTNTHLERFTSKQKVNAHSDVYKQKYLCTTVKDSTSKVMSPCPQRKCEKDRAQLKLHRNKAENSL